MKRLKKEIVAIITQSTLWNSGKEAHNALSELTESVYHFIINTKKNEKTKEECK